jgi:hypothetical protein
MKKGTTILLVALGWIASNIHRVRNGMPDYSIKPFLIDRSIDLQWYMKDLGELIFFLIIAYLALVNAKPSVKIIFRGLIFVQLLELVNYILYFKHSELILWAEGLTILGTIIILLMKWKFEPL